MDDAKTRDSLNKAVQTYLDTEDEYKAKKLKANAEINKERDEALAKVLSRVGKLDIMREAFLAAKDVARGRRRTLAIFPDQVEAKDDLDLAGGFARVILASDDMFEPLYDADLKAHLEVLVEELESEPSNENESVIRMHQESEAA